MVLDCRVCISSEQVGDVCVWDVEESHGVVFWCVGVGDGVLSGSGVVGGTDDAEPRLKEI